MPLPSSGATMQQPRQASISCCAGRPAGSLPEREGSPDPGIDAAGAARMPAGSTAGWEGGGSLRLANPARAGEAAGSLR